MSNNALVSRVENDWVLVLERSMHHAISYLRRLKSRSI